MTDILTVFPGPTTRGFFIAKFSLHSEMTLEEWKEKYLRESPTAPITEDPEYEIYDEKEGFMSFNLDYGHKTLFIMEICGNLKYWFGQAIEMAKGHDFKKIIGVSKHSEKAICRMLKCRYLGHLFEMEV